MPLCEDNGVHLELTERARQPNNFNKSTGVLMPKEAWRC